MALVPVAAYELDVAWDRASAGGWFTLDVSELDGTDVLAASEIVVPSFSGAYDRLDHDGAIYRTRVERFSFSRGRTRTLASVEGGKATVEVVDPAGLYNPDNPASPLFGQTRDPGRPIRIRARWNATVWPLFYGFVNSIDYRPAGRRSTAVLECDDLFVKLQEPPIIGTMTTTTTGAVIGEILDEIGWSDPVYRDLDLGDAIASFAEATGETAALALIEALLAGEFGLFYVNGAAVAVFEDRHARSTKSVAYTLTDVIPAVGPGSSLDRIANRATFTKTGSTAQTYTDTASADPETGYGLRDAGTVESPYLADDAAAADRARYVVGRRKDPSGPLWALGVEGRTDALLQAVLDLEISDRVAVSEAQTGTDFDGYIERLEHSVDRRRRVHRANYVLSERGAAEFVLDVSELDGTDVLAL